MVFAYSQLGLTPLAADAQAVLDTNFPGYLANIELSKKESLLKSATFGLLGSDDEPPQIKRPADAEQPETQE